MTTIGYTVTLLVDQTPNEAFEAIKNVRGWWSGLYSEKIEGESDKPGDEFTILAGGGVHYTKQELVELLPDTKIVWLIADSKLTFVQDQTEWTGTKLQFEISKQGDKTKIVFTHIGLVPTFQCYDSCTPVWTQYMEQLKKWLPVSTLN